MGISGLLPLLKSCMDDINISQYAGHRVAVDAYCWLHRGAYTSAQQICTATHLPLQQRYKQCIDWCTQRIRMLLDAKVIPVLVFDGAKLPLKKYTNVKRAGGRKQALAEGQQLLSQGNSAEAYKQFTKAIEITPNVAKLLMNVCQSMNVEYIVAPYEADAQLAYLSMHHHVTAIISEDSDLLCFGALRVVYKLDQAGNGQQIRWKNLETSSEINLVGFDLGMLQLMAILSGCDYLPSLPGMGLKKAHSVVSQFQTVDRCIRKLQFDAKYNIPANYAQDVEQAYLTFRHQRVYDPQSKALVHLTPLPEGITQKHGVELAFLGPLWEDTIVQQVCTGQLNPDTRKPYDLTEVRGSSKQPTIEQLMDGQPPRSICSSPEPSASDNDIELAADNPYNPVPVVTSSYFEAQKPLQLTNSAATRQAFKPPRSAADANHTSLHAFEHAPAQPHKKQRSDVPKQLHSRAHSETTAGSWLSSYTDLQASLPPQKRQALNNQLFLSQLRKRPSISTTATLTTRSSSANKPDGPRAQSYSLQSLSQPLPSNKERAEIDNAADEENTPPAHEQEIVDLTTFQHSPQHQRRLHKASQKQQSPSKRRKQADDTAHRPSNRKVAPTTTELLDKFRHTQDVIAMQVAHTQSNVLSSLARRTTAKHATAPQHSAPAEQYATAMIHDLDLIFDNPVTTTIHTAHPTFLEQFRKSSAARH